VSALKRTTARYGTDISSRLEPVSPCLSTNSSRLSVKTIKSRITLYACCSFSSGSRICCKSCSTSARSAAPALPNNLPNNPMSNSCKKIQPKAESGTRQDVELTERSLAASNGKSQYTGPLNGLLFGVDHGAGYFWCRLFLVY